MVLEFDLAELIEIVLDVFVLLLTLIELGFVFHFVQVEVTELWIVLHLFVLIRFHLLFIELFAVKTNVFLAKHLVVALSIQQLLAILFLSDLLLFIFFLAHIFFIDLFFLLLALFLSPSLFTFRHFLLRNMILLNLSLNPLPQPSQRRPQMLIDQSQTLLLCKPISPEFAFRQQRRVHGGDHFT